METAQFEKLEEKINLALKVITELKQEKQLLNEELSNTNNRITELEGQLTQKTEEFNQLQTENEQKGSNMNEAAERIQNLINRLEQENLEQLIQ